MSTNSSYSSMTLNLIPAQYFRPPLGGEHARFLHIAGDFNFFKEVSRPRPQQDEYKNSGMN